MKRSYFKNQIKRSVCVLLLFVVTTLKAQIGIGTVTPAASAALDITSTTQGMLMPRMTTVQRQAIASPADGLSVYDTDLKSLYHYNTSTSSWIRVSSDVTGRTNFKRIKSTDVLATVLAAELAAGGGTKYLLTTNTLYEINGTINVDFPIDLNNAYISGLDTNEDKLVRATGILFQGATGGSIRTLTLQATAGSIFSLSGTAAQNLIFRDSVVVSSASVGSISGFGLVFLSIVQFAANTTGITYNNITQLLISNAGWFGNNAGTYETLTGTFTLVEKQGGFSSVNGTAIGLDVSSNPTITSDAVMESVVFTGTLSTGLYVKRYTVGSYTGYNFNNDWTVRSGGIPTEGDAVATGNLYDPNNTTATTTNAAGAPGLAGLKVVTNTTTATNLFRFDSPSTGRLTYRGKKTRTFQVNASISFIETTGGTNTTYVFYFVKILADGTTVVALPETETFNDTNGGFIQSFPVSGSVTLNKDEGVEVYLKRINTGTKVTVNTYSFNITVQ